MDAATSATVKEEHQSSICPYCSAKIKLPWEIKIDGGLERKVAVCENGHVLRKRIKRTLNIDQLVKAHSLDWGTVKITSY